MTGQITLTKEIIESETNLLFVCQPFLSLSKNTDSTCQNIHFLQIVTWIFFILRRFLKNSAIFVKKISSGFILPRSIRFPNLNLNQLVPGN